MFVSIFSLEKQISRAYNDPLNINIFWGHWQKLFVFKHFTDKNCAPVLNSFPPKLVGREGMDYALPETCSWLGWERWGTSPLTRAVRSLTLLMGVFALTSCLLTAQLLSFFSLKFVCPLSAWEEVVCLSSLPFPSVDTPPSTEMVEVLYLNVQAGCLKWLLVSPHLPQECIKGEFISGGTIFLLFVKDSSTLKAIKVQKGLELLKQSNVSIAFVKIAKIKIKKTSSLILILFQEIWERPWNL